MKKILKICAIAAGVMMLATVIYTIVTGVVLFVAMSLVMFLFLGLVVCEQIRSEKEDGQPRSKGYFFFFLFAMIFQFLVTLILLITGNLTFRI